jgi:hypothetical protein
VTKDEALKLINAGRIEEWNEVRRTHPTWNPDLRESDLKTGLLLCFRVIDSLEITSGYPDVDDLGKVARSREDQYSRVKRCNLKRADLRGCKLPPLEASSLKPILFRTGDRPELLTGKSGSQVVQRLNCPDFEGALYDLNTTGNTGIVRALGARLFVSSDNDPFAAQALAVFISYAWADANPVRAIDRWLRDRGIRTFIDKRDFFAGAKIRDEILRVMSASNVVVICYSEKAKERPWIEFEQQLAGDMEMEAKASGRNPPRIMYLCFDKTPLPSVVERNRIAILAAGKRFPDVCEELYRQLLMIPLDDEESDPSSWQKFVFPEG